MVASVLMHSCAGVVIFLCVALISCSAIPKPDDKKDRVYDPDLSNEPHQKEGEHNSDYDHEAFLGRDESKQFDELEPEESKRRLGLIVDKIDVDKDGFVTKEELKNWIKLVQQRYITSDTEKSWKEHKLDTDKLKWEAYKDRTYGTSDTDENNDDHYKDMIARDKRRWDKADEDKDGHLTYQEYTNFQHPEEADHMRDVVVMETLDDIDKDHDGKISLEEYIADIKAEDKDDDDDDDEDKEAGHHDDEDDHDEEDHAWLESEKKEFQENLDRNNDGFLDNDEMKLWLLPEDQNHPITEAEHLLSKADANRDGQLSKDEIVLHHELFAGSQATDFGEILNKHDEF